jgi:ectoine hydroxylase-related dioxygenase (phytanoyl-CoA dioxygenase family)
MPASRALQLRKLYEDTERDASLPADWHDNPQLLLGWARDLVTDPLLLDAVSDLIGPDILCWEMDCFAKAPNSSTFVSWHQDITYWGLEADRVVTAWVSLGESREASGCLAVARGSHLSDVVPHHDTYAEDNMLSRGQVANVEVKAEDVKLLELGAGECSFHHVKIVHGSGPNQSPDRRIGLAIRYMATSVRPLKGARDFATLVRGEDRFGHFDAMPLPDGNHADFALHRRVNDHRLRLTMPG